MSVEKRHVYEFGPFHLDTASRLLLRDSEVVPLKAKVLETLLVLVENSGQVVSKEHLMEAIWPDTAVEENNLTQNIYSLRKVLGERPGEHRYISTVSGQGYRFVATVRELPYEGNDLLIGKLTRARVLTEDEISIGENGQAAAQDAPKVNRIKKTRPAVFAISVLLSALAGTLIYFFAWNRSQQPQSGLGVRSIAILPFKSLDPNETDPALGSKLADAMITRLGRLRQISVRSTRVVANYESKTIDPIAAARELQVDAVLDATFQRDADRLRLRARLLRASDGQQLWSGVFDEHASDPFAWQDALAEQTALAMVPRLTGTERQLVARRDTENVEANRRYSEAHYHWNKRDVEGIRKSVQLLEQAIRLDPQYARAYAGLADSYITLSDYDLLEPNEAFTKARDAAQKALEIDGSLAEARTALAMVKAGYDWDWSGADQAFQQAIEINPHYATAHQWYAEFLSSLGRHEQALFEIRLAQQLDPLSLIIPTMEALVLNYARDYDAVIAQCQRVISRDPNFAEVYVYLLHAYTQKRMFREAMDAYQKWCTLMGYSTPAVAAICVAPVLDATDYWQKMVKLSKPPRGSDLDAAQAWAQLGETNKAFALMEQAYAKRGYGIRYLKVDPNLDPLRPDPRFEQLLQRVGLAQ